VAILREHFIDKLAVSQVCDQHGLNPTAFYRWQKEFFENGPAAFESRRAGGDARTRQLEERLEKLQAKIARKDEVIAELMEETLRVKKSLGEI
jgi:transposase-like protein